MLKARNRFYSYSGCLPPLRLLPGPSFDSVSGVHVGGHLRGAEIRFERPSRYVSSLSFRSQATDELELIVAFVTASVFPPSRNLHFDHHRFRLAP
jgi:hypothetical protein